LFRNDPRRRCRFCLGPDIVRGLWGTIKASIFTRDANPGAMRRFEDDQQQRRNNKNVFLEAITAGAA